MGMIFKQPPIIGGSSRPMSYARGLLTDEDYRRIREDVQFVKLQTPLALQMAWNLDPSQASTLYERYRQKHHAVDLLHTDGATSG